MIYIIRSLRFLFILLLLFSFTSVSAQTDTPPPPEPTSTPYYYPLTPTESILPTFAPVYGADAFDCPAGIQPDGAYTLTPSYLWSLNCSRCLTPPVPSATLDFYTLLTQELGTLQANYDQTPQPTLTASATVPPSATPTAFQEITCVSSCNQDSDTSVSYTFTGSDSFGVGFSNLGQIVYTRYASNVTLYVYFDQVDIQMQNGAGSARNLKLHYQHRGTVLRDDEQYLYSAVPAANFINHTSSFSMLNSSGDSASVNMHDQILFEPGGSGSFPVVWSYRITVSTLPIDFSTPVPLGNYCYSVDDGSDDGDPAMPDTFWSIDPTPECFFFPVDLTPYSPPPIEYTDDVMADLLLFFQNLFIGFFFGFLQFVQVVIFSLLPTQTICFYQIIFEGVLIFGVYLDLNIFIILLFLVNIYILFTYNGGRKNG